MQRIAAKTAWTAALLAGGACLLVALVTRISYAWPVAVAAAVGPAMYFAVRRRVTDRLQGVHDALGEIRREQGYADAPIDNSGDEIDRLVRRGDQTRYAVRKHISDLSRADNYRREYVGDVSHEIKTPVFAIQGFAETLLNGALEDPEVNRGFVRKILHHAFRLSALAKDLGEISRLETGAFQLDRESFAAEDIFEEVAESLEHAARKRNIRLHSEIHPGVEWVDGDRDQLRQVLVNLVDNAIKYNNDGGEVRLVARRSGEFVRISVEDNGIGMHGEDVSRVTERFFRVDKSRSRAQGGTGLGLSIVKHILGAHGAEIDIESAPGAGSTFSFSLPAAEKPVFAESF